MYKLRIFSVGKTKEKWLHDAFQEYITRLRPIAQIECLWAKDSCQLLDWAEKERSLCCLDPGGHQFSSEGFSAFLTERLETEGSRLTFIIGGAEGLPLKLKEQKLLSLSSLTLTHQMTRLVLVEQIYRAFEIQKGSSYHK